MNPDGWRDELELVLRPDDGERIGYLRQVDGDMWEPLNLLGIPLRPAGTRDDATCLVTSGGPDSLHQVWWCRAPMPMVAARLGCPGGR